MMSEATLHRLIVEGIKASGGTGLWLQDAFKYLVDHGATKAEALRALDKFVDDVDNEERYR